MVAAESLTRWCLPARARRGPSCSARQVGIEPDPLMPADIDETPEQRESIRAALAQAAAAREGRALAAGRRFARRRNGQADASSSPPTRWSPSAAASCPRRKHRRSRTPACSCCPAGRTGSIPAIALITPAAKLAPAAGRDPGALQAPVARGIELYLASGEWRGKAGGYAIQGRAGASCVICRLLQQCRRPAAL